MRSPRTTLMALIFAAVLAIAATGCGGSEIAADEVPGSPPALTVPSDDDLGGGGANAAEDGAGANADEDAPDAESTADAETADPNAAVPQADDTSGGTTAPEATAAPDTSTNDTVPEPDSPPAQFEDFCEQNAGAC